MSTGATSVAAWNPPPRMSVEVARDWRAFYMSIWKKYGITPEQYRALFIDLMWVL